MLPVTTLVPIWAGPHGAAPPPPGPVPVIGAFTLPWGVPLGLWSLSRPAYVEPVVPPGLPVTQGTLNNPNDQ